MCRERKRHKDADLRRGPARHHPGGAALIAEAANAELVVVPAKDGRTDIDALRQLLDDTTASFYVQQPNYYGLLEDCEELGQIVHEAGAKLHHGLQPHRLGHAEDTRRVRRRCRRRRKASPWACPLSFGGPYLGFMACHRSDDAQAAGPHRGRDGRRRTANAAFVLTLQAREQHIRREKASSNICSNQALCALTAAVYLAAMGPGGLAEVATQCYSKAHYAGRSS